MALKRALNALWPVYCADLDFDAALREKVAELGPCSAEDVSDMLLVAFDKTDASLNAHGAALAALLLEALRLAEPTAATAAVEALQRLREPETFEDLSVDFPRLPRYLAFVEGVLSVADAPKTARILVVRNGLASDSPVARALRDVAEVRIPGSRHIAETGNEDAQGRGEQEMAEVLRAHVRSRRVDAVVAQSRGCRLVAQYLTGGEDPCWDGPVLALSPAGEWGLTLLASPAPSPALVAASGNDLVELGGGHPVLQRADIEALREAAEGRPGRAFKFDEERRGGWEDIVATVLQDVLAKGFGGSDDAPEGK